MEEFRDVVGYEGLYKVSNLGRVKSLARISHKSNGENQPIKERILKPYLMKVGYLKVGLSKNKKGKARTIHQLVAEAFLNHKPDGTNKLVCDHINNIKTDNRLENIQVVTNRVNNSKDRKGTSRHTGVSWVKSRNKWKSCITINGEAKFLGVFTDESEAAKAYKEALAYA